jgi:thioredoxin-related protein
MNMATKSLLAVGVLAAIVALFVWTSGSAASGDWVGYGDALTKAEQTKRVVLVDVYTNWCVWCKKMDSDVYGDSQVQAVLDEHFVITKINAESATAHSVEGREVSERDIAKGHGVTGYPTTLFLTAEGKPITVLPGYIPRETFLHVLEYVHTRSYETQGWEEFLQGKKS